MTRGMLWMLRCVALGHVGCGTLLLLAAAWFAVSAFRVIPYMSTGTVYANTARALVVAAARGLPVAALGIWMLVLGCRLWSGQAWLRTALLWTHGCLLVLGSLAVAVGVYAVGAAGRSAARGGGLLGSIAFVPLMFGIPLMLLAISSIAVAVLVIQSDRADSRG